MLRGRRLRCYGKCLPFLGKAAPQAPADRRRQRPGSEAHPEVGGFPLTPRLLEAEVGVRCEPAKEGAHFPAQRGGMLRAPGLAVSVLNTCPPVSRQMAVSGGLLAWQPDTGGPAGGLGTACACPQMGGFTSGPSSSPLSPPPAPNPSPSRPSPLWFCKVQT